MNDATLIDVLERIRSRFYGKYRGTVTEVDAATMRVKAMVPGVLGSQTTGWCMPCVPYAGPQVGFAFLPEVGSGIWIEFEGGDVSYPIWTGSFWHDGEIPSDATDKVKAIVTVAKNKILLDDQGGKITLSDQNGNTVVMESSGVTIKRGSMQVVVSDSNVNVNNGSLEVM